MQLDKFLITNERFYTNIDANLSYAYSCGVSKVYLREFEISRFYRFIDICSKLNILLFVNYIDKYINDILRYASGIHLKSIDFDLITLIPDEKLVSYSAHNISDVINAYNKNIDYIFLSPIFNVENKNPALGVEYLKNIPSKYKDRIYALGGINRSNIHCFKNINIKGVAGIRMFLKV